MFRVLIAVALIQHNLGKPLEDGLVIPHDVEMIPVEEHGHHFSKASSLERISIEDNEIPLNHENEGEIDDNDNIPRPDRATDIAPCSAEVEETGEVSDCKDISSKIYIKQETKEHIETTEHENVEGQKTNGNVEIYENKETDDGAETNEGQKTNESVETTEGKDTDTDEETNEGKGTNESIETNKTVETNEVVLLNQTIRMNSSAIADGKLTIVLHFEVLDDKTVKVVSSEIVNSDVSNANETNEDDDNYDFIHVSGPVHAKGKVCVGAHYGCEDHGIVEMDNSELVHPGVAKDNNETVYDEDDGDEDDDDENDDIVNFCGPVHAQGNVCVGAHYECGGPPISMCFSRPCAHGQHFFHPSSENDDEEEEDYSVHFQCCCPNIACQYYPSAGSFGPCRLPEYHFYEQDHHFDNHHEHNSDHDQDHHFDRHHHSQNHLFDHKDHDFDHYEDKFHHQEDQFEDFEEYFSRILGDDYDSGEEDDFPRCFPVSGYVPASGSVKIAARY